MFVLGGVLSGAPPIHKCHCFDSRLAWIYQKEYGSCNILENVELLAELKDVLQGLLVLFFLD